MGSDEIHVLSPVTWFRTEIPQKDVDEKRPVDGEILNPYISKPFAAVNGLEIELRVIASNNLKAALNI